MREPHVCTTLILGVGNNLLGDEGVGIHATHYLLARSLPAGVEIVDGGTLSFTLAGPVAEVQDLIVVDAAELDAAPGTVRRFIGEDMDRFLYSSRRRSVHEVGLDDLLTLVRLSGDLPARRALVAVQPGSMGWNKRLSAEVEAALPEVAEAVYGILAAWADA